MKKTAAVISAIVLVFSLSACGSRPAETSAAATEAPVTVEETATAQETAAKAEASEEEEEFVFETPAPIPLPEEYLSCEYAAGHAFDPAEYPALSKQSDYAEEEADQLVEGVDDILAFDYYEAGMEPEYYYGEHAVQMTVQEEGYGTRICSAIVTTGEPVLDKAMQAAGYRDYEITYFYKSGIFAEGAEEIMPVYASLYIDDIFYDYYYIDNALVTRFGPEGTIYNPETNDFMNTVFRAGCYYGRYLDAEKGRYSLMVYAPDYVYEKDGHIVIIAGLSGIDKDYTFFVDEETEFDENCDSASFEDYKEGETPYEWYQRMIKTDEDGTAVVGVFDVKTTGQHVDKLCGCYWWD